MSHASLPLTSTSVPEPSSSWAECRMGYQAPLSEACYASPRRPGCTINLGNASQIVISAETGRNGKRQSPCQAHANGPTCTASPLRSTSCRNHQL